MQQVTDRNFGYLIAYILPGFVALAGLSAVLPTFDLWLSGISGEDMPSIAGFMYVTLTSVGLGMTTSAIRFVVLDRINDLTGMPRPHWDDSKLQANFDAFRLIVDQHYRYYQFHGNMLVSLVIVYVARRWANGFMFNDGIEFLLIPIGVVFWITARSNLTLYFRRSINLLGQDGDKS
tara:strand:- start:2465 stop:2995 length:531 start_codon:yes stop_codon:yes gene_type:complete